jgi:hypothetical protein
VERRSPWSPDIGPDWTEHKIAQLQLGEDGRWSGRWADRNGRWRTYPGAPQADSPVPLLEEIDRNPNGVFWGLTRASPLVGRGSCCRRRGHDPLGG